MGACNQRLHDGCSPPNMDCTLLMVVARGSACIPPDGGSLDVDAMLGAACDTGSLSQIRRVTVENAGGVLTLSNDTVTSEASTGTAPATLALAWDVTTGELRVAVTLVADTEGVSGFAELGWLDAP